MKPPGGESMVCLDPACHRRPYAANPHISILTWQVELRLSTSKAVCVGYPGSLLRCHLGLLQLVLPCHDSPVKAEVRFHAARIRGSQGVDRPAAQLWSSHETQHITWGLLSGLLPRGAGSCHALQWS